MKNLRAQFEALKTSMDNNPKISIALSDVGDVIRPDIFDDTEQEYGVTYSDSIKEFSLTVGMTLRFIWEVKPQYKTDDSEFRGSIFTYDISEMIRGPRRQFWKDIFWFEESNTELNEQLKRFVPFDKHDGFHCVTGFMKEGNDTDGYTVSDQLYLNRANKELVRHPFTLDEYLEFICKTKGYLYFLDYYNRPDSEEFERFMRLMPQIFDDFDEEYFIKLSKK